MSTSVAFLAIDTSCSVSFVVSKESTFSVLVVRSFCKSWASFSVALSTPFIAFPGSGQGVSGVVSVFDSVFGCVLLVHVSSSKLETILTIAVAAAVNLSISSRRSQSRTQ